MIASRVMAVVGAALLVAVVGGLAGAATATRTDAKGDAPTAYDVTRVRYAYDAERVLAVAKVPGLGKVGDAQLSVTKFDVFEAGYVGRILREPGRKPQVKLFFYNHFDLLPRACDGLMGTWGDGKVRISIPTACLRKGYAAPDVFAQFGIGQDGDFDLAPAVKDLEQG